jgi:hypothetical protein
MTDKESVRYRPQRRAQGKGKTELSPVRQQALGPCSGILGLREKENMPSAAGSITAAKSEQGCMEGCHNAFKSMFGAKQAPREDAWTYGTQRAPKA